MSPVGCCICNQRHITYPADGESVSIKRARAGKSMGKRRPTVMIGNKVHQSTSNTHLCHARRRSTGAREPSS